MAGLSLSSMTGLSSIKLPNKWFGLSNPRAEQWVALQKVFVSILVALNEEENIIRVFQIYADLRSLISKDANTSSELLKMDELLDNFFEELENSELILYQNTLFDGVLKLHILQLYPRKIEDFGVALNTSTSPFEALHKQFIKRFVGNLNWRTGWESQVCIFSNIIFILVRSRFHMH